LDAEDFSALSDEFKLAAAVLREDFQQPFALVKTIGAKGEITLEDYREWPLFKEFRKQKDLEPIITKIFKEPLNKIRVEGGVPIAADQSDHSTPSLFNGADKSVDPSRSRRRRTRKSFRAETPPLLN